MNQTLNPNSPPQSQAKRLCCILLNSSFKEQASLMSRVWGLGFRVWGLGFRVWALGCGLSGLGFRVWGLGFGV